MTNINPTPSWAAVRQLEIGEFATGGANGNMNEQAKSLAARSELLKQYAALPYESKTGGYALGATVKLDNGDIVKSTIDGNTNDPNVDMTGWVKVNAASQIFDESGLSQQQINDKSPIFCDTVSELRSLKPRNNGSVMFVKSHSNNDSGGLVYTWDADSVALDDDGWIIKSDLSDTGRWVADFGNAPITPQHFGAIGDGSIDERLICEKSIVAASKTSMRWLVPHGDTYLLNSYANYSEIATFSAGMLPIFSDVNYEIQGTLKVGAFFDDKDFLVFTDINAATPSGWTPVENWAINGMGNIDLSLSGKRRTTFKARIPIYLETSYDAKISTIKIHDGDTTNTIVTGGKNITIDGVRFVDLMQDNSANDDHSSIYAKAENTIVKNCYFEMNTINGNLNACPVELHNSNSSFKDSVITGYRNTHILAAITTEFPYIKSLEVSGLKAKVHRNFSTLDVWTGAVLINAQIHDNIITMLPFPSDAAITGAGIDPLTVDGPQTMVLVTNDSAGGFNLVAGSGSNINYYDNTYVSEADSNIADNLRSLVFFYKAPVGGISVFNNTVRAKNILLASGGLQATNKFILDRFRIYENTYDETFFTATEIVKIETNYVQSSTFNFKFRKNVAVSILATITVASLANSIANEFIVRPEYTENINTCFNTTGGLFDASSNKVSYPETISIYMGSDLIGESNFYRNNIKTAKVIGRGAVPDNVSFSDFISNNGDNKLVAMCRNPTGNFGNYAARLLLSN